MTPPLRLEVIPLPGLTSNFAQNLPPGASVTVTASPRRGLQPTIELATRLASEGVRAVPHLSARLVTDTAQLAGLVQKLARGGIDEVFVVGGDSEAPAGEFTTALDLLVAMDRVGHDFTIGVAGYPETHPRFSDDVALRALIDKQPHADYLVSQMCFDATTLMAWVRMLRARGIVLPIRVGIPGPVSTVRLLRIATKVGIGESVRVLTKQHRLWHLAGPGMWRPDDLLTELNPLFTDPRNQVSGLHVSTFNAVDDTVTWWLDSFREQTSA